MAEFVYVYVIKAIDDTGREWYVDTTRNMHKAIDIVTDTAARYSDLEDKKFYVRWLRSPGDATGFLNPGNHHESVGKPWLSGGSGG